MSETKIPFENMLIPRDSDTVLTMLIFAQTFITVKRDSFTCAQGCFNDALEIHIINLWLE